jgi:hypothetical protein
MAFFWRKRGVWENDKKRGKENDEERENGEWIWVKQSVWTTLVKTSGQLNVW